MLPESRYEVERLELAQGARLLFYTDGLIEVFRDHEEFGEERLMAGFRGCTERTCGPMLDSLWQQLNDFAEAAMSSPQSALLRTGPPGLPSNVRRAQAPCARHS